MALITFSPSSAISAISPSLLKLRTRTFSHLNFAIFSPSSKNVSTLISPIHPSRTLDFTCKDSSTNLDNVIDFDWGKEEEEEDLVELSPWEGAVIYKRNPSVTHLEYCTTLERLGLGKHSTEVSKSRASAMGLRLTKSVKDYPKGTPVLISVDVCRKKNKVRLDGIIRTVLTLGCNRCGELNAAECVFSNFTLLLVEEPIDETDVINIGVIFGEDKHKTTTDAEEDDEASIHLDDRLYFPAEEKEIDISKNIRDLVHVEITINAVCDLGCKGLCLRCGANLNINACNCNKQELEGKSCGPLGNLRTQMQKN